MYVLVLEHEWFASLYPVGWRKRATAEYPLMIPNIQFPAVAQPGATAVWWHEGCIDDLGLVICVTDKGVTVMWTYE